IEKKNNIKLLHNILSVKMVSVNDISEWEQGQHKATAPYIYGLEKRVSITGLQKTHALGFISSSGFLDIASWLNVSKKVLVEKGQYIEEALDYKKVELSNDKIILPNIVEAGKII